MTPRDTSTGRVLEEMILPSLRRGGYNCCTQVTVGNRPGGGTHKVDVVATDRNGQEYLVSLKWQQVSGTAEQKVPFEVICLADVILNSQGRYSKAYLVLGGDGWTLREFYIGRDLSEHLKYSHLVIILSLETFVARANRGEL